MTKEIEIKVQIADKSGHSQILLSPAETVETIRENLSAWVYVNNQMVDPDQVDEAKLIDAQHVRICRPLGGRPEVEPPTNAPTYEVLIIGAGGIGALLAKHLVRAYTISNDFHNWPLDLTIMDGDVVEMRNLPHQPYSEGDVEEGLTKVEALRRSLDYLHLKKDVLKLNPIPENFSEETDLSNYILVVVAVDRDEPRDLVHNKAEHWLDLRASGDGFMMWSSVEGKEGLEEYRNPSEGAAASCQLEGAVEGRGNIQFGFALAAAHGAQWILQWIRGSNPDVKERLVPPARTYTINMGELPTQIEKWRKEYRTPCGHNIKIQPVKKVGGMHQGKLWCNIQGPEIEKLGQQTKTFYQEKFQGRDNLYGAFVRISKIIKCPIEDITEVC